LKIEYNNTLLILEQSNIYFRIDMLLLIGFASE